MCRYYYAIVRWRDCEQDPKHTGSIRKEYTCEEAEKVGKTCPNPTEMPWQSGTTSIKGSCYKCGMPVCRQTIVPFLTKYQPTPLELISKPIHHFRKSCKTSTKTENERAIEQTSRRRRERSSCDQQSYFHQGRNTYLQHPTYPAHLP